MKTKEIWISLRQDTWSIASYSGGPRVVAPGLHFVVLGLGAGGPTNG